MEHRETKLESQMIYEGKILRLRKDTVRLENGHTTIREVIDHSGGVSIVALGENECLYMVRQYRYPSDLVLVELPAGKLVSGEDPENCGRRELEEECGCIADQFHLLARLIPTCAYDAEVIYVFHAAGRSKVSQHLDPDGFLTVEQIPFSQAVEMVLNNELPDAKT